MQHITTHIEANLIVPLPNQLPADLDFVPRLSFDLSRLDRDRLLFVRLFANPLVALQFYA